MNVYRFRIELEWEEEVWRTIELRSDQTLHTIHNAIQSAFRWDDDHLYSFLLSGKYWDKKAEYISPRAADDGFGSWMRGGQKS